MQPTIRQVKNYRDDTKCIICKKSIMDTEEHAKKGTKGVTLIIEGKVRNYAICEKCDNKKEKKNVKKGTK